MTRGLLTTVALVAAVAAISTTAAWAATRSSDPRVSSAAVGPATMGNGYGASMMGYTLAGSTKVRTLADAKRQAQRFADRFDLRVGEVMRFSNNFYASLVGRGGKGATEVLVYRNGAVRIEFGPAMMWNTEYGPMSGYGGMMGGGYDGSLGTASGTVSAKDAVAIANRWLAAHRPGLRAGDVDAFPGYYTLHTLRNGKVAGMLSVNAFTAAVWYHWWHGRFVAMTE